MRKVIAAIAAATLLAPAGGIAQEIPMPQMLFKNTLRVQNRFATSEIFVEPDHTWTAAAVTAFGVTSGIWEFKDGALCATQTNPPQTNSPPKSFCEPLSSRKLGDTWEKMDAKVGLVRTSLVPGRRTRFPSEQ